MLSYKQSRRREDDLAIVNAGLRVTMVPPGERGEGEGEGEGGGGKGGEGESGSWKIGDCCLSYGGMNKTTVVATQTQQALIGK